MILMQVLEWLGPSRAVMDRGDRKFTEKLRGIASRLSLSEALLCLREYENEYRRTYSETAVNFNVIGIQTIPDLSNDELEAGRIEVIEESLRRLRERRE